MSKKAPPRFVTVFFRFCESISGTESVVVLTGHTDTLLNVLPWMKFSDERSFRLIFNPRKMLKRHRKFQDPLQLPVNPSKKVFQTPNFPNKLELKVGRLVWRSLRKSEIPGTEFSEYREIRNRRKKCDRMRER